MARKNNKPSNLASTVVVIVAAIIAAFIVYKQVFLVSKVTTNLPENALSRGLEACLQENLTPAQLKQELGKANLSFDFGGVLGSMWETLSRGLVKTVVEKNYVGEVKVLNIDDFLGKNAEIRVTGSVALLSKIPVVGDFRSRKDYQTTLIKRGDHYHFDGLSVKNPDSQQWDEWQCAQELY